MTAGFFPSEEELSLAERIFTHVGDSSNPRLITGDAAIDIFMEGVGLSPAVLSTIWGIADEDGNGSLSEKGVTISLRLIGWAQSGEEVTPRLVNIPGPLPVIKGISDLPSEADRGKDLAEEGGGLVQWPLFTEQDRETFQSLFLEYGPIDGLLDGERAQGCFLKSNLSHETLWQIWNLADTQNRGSLDINDFSVGMYLIQASASGHIPSIPSSLPTHIRKTIMEEPDVVDDLSRKPMEVEIPETPSVPSSAVLPTTVHAPPLPKKLQRSQSFPQQASHPQDWDVKPTIRARADRHFDILDPDGRGFVEGEAAAKFMLRYRLPPDDLAQIWDLADLNNDNRLTRDGFAVALHLVQEKLSGNALPFVLPHSLIPPAMRSKASATRPRKSLQHSISTGNVNVKNTPPSISIRSLPPPVPPKPFQEINQPHSIEPEHSSPTNVNGISRRKRQSSVELHTVSDQVQGLEQENASLNSHIQELTAELEVQREYQTKNKALWQENQTLTAKMQEMEHITSQLISATETNPIAEDLTRQNKRLSRRIADLDAVKSQLADASNRLETTTRENRNLKSRLQEVQEAADLAQQSLDEAEVLRKQVELLEQDNDHLRSRALEMEKSISRPRPADSSANIREMEILMGDVTRENDNLKKRLREIESSSAQLLLSSNHHAVHDGLRRDNHNLTLQVRELELLTRQLQSSSEDNELRRVLGHVTQENEDLKTQLHIMQRDMARIQSNDRTEGLQREVDALKTEIRHLNVQLQDATSSRRHEDAAVPPPAYDDTLFTPV